MGVLPDYMCRVCEKTLNLIDLTLNESYLSHFLACANVKVSTTRSNTTQPLQRIHKIHLFKLCIYIVCL